MATLIDLRRRIRSVKNTRQLTKAMKSVSAAKLKRAQNQVYQTRPFSQKLASILSNIRARTPDLHHPFFENRDEKNIDLIITTGDKGLCGAFNSNTLKFAEQKIEELRKEGKNVNIIVLGKKGFEFLKFKKIEISKYFINFFMKLDYLKSVEISDNVISDFLEKKSDAVYIIYNKFYSVSKTEISFEKLLPIGEIEETDEEKLEYEFEPSPEEIFESLLPIYLKNYFYRILLESAASEHAARMVAMDLATRNASDMINALTLTMNKIRQAAITKEILEITTATEAMKK